MPRLLPGAPPRGGTRAPGGSGLGAPWPTSCRPSCACSVDAEGATLDSAMDEASTGAAVAVCACTGGGAICGGGTAGIGACNSLGSLSPGVEGRTPASPRVDMSTNARLAAPSRNTHSASTSQRFDHGADAPCKDCIPAGVANVGACAGVEPVDSGPSPAVQGARGGGIGKEAGTPGADALVPACARRGRSSWMTVSFASSHSSSGTSPSAGDASAGRVSPLWVVAGISSHSLLFGGAAAIDGMIAPIGALSASGRNKGVVPPYRARELRERSLSPCP